MTERETDGYEVLPFSIHGETMGQGHWNYADLSAPWLQTCREILRDGTERIHLILPGNFEHIRLKITAAGGAALVSYYVRERLASSLVFLSGHSVTTDRQVAEMFVASMNRAVPKDGCHQNDFDTLLTVVARPLMAVVPMPDDLISEEDHELVREHGLHLAAAFFKWNRQ